MVTDLRKYCMNLTNEELWKLFDQMDTLEKTAKIDDDAELRTIANLYLNQDNILSMTIVGHEVWRELAQRGSDYTF